MRRSIHLRCYACETNPELLCTEEISVSRWFAMATAMGDNRAVRSSTEGQ
jgi:hypothetical protein